MNQNTTRTRTRTETETETSSEIDPERWPITVDPIANEPAAMLGRQLMKEHLGVSS